MLQMIIHAKPLRKTLTIYKYKIPILDLLLIYKRQKNFYNLNKKFNIIMKINKKKSIHKEII